MPFNVPTISLPTHRMPSGYIPDKAYAKAKVWLWIWRERQYVTTYQRDWERRWSSCWQCCPLAVSLWQLESGCPGIKHWPLNTFSRHLHTDQSQMLGLFSNRHFRYKWSRAKSKSAINASQVYSFWASWIVWKHSCLQFYLLLLIMYFLPRVMAGTWASG